MIGPDDRQGGIPERVIRGSDGRAGSQTALPEKAADKVLLAEEFFAG